MTKFFIKSFFLLFVFNFLLGCQALKDGLEGNKKSKSAEEFLIEKKNPLVLPPDYSELPLPKKGEIDETTVLNESFDLEKIIKKTPKKKSETTRSGTSLSKSVLKKINKN
tara:strand:- start:1478 stop:1807 length:330 start_codon:yes stop_codon:yes gene_type:complete